MFVFQTGTSRLLNPAIVHELVFNPNPIESCGERRGNVPHPSGQCHEQRGVSRCQLLASAGPSGNLKSPCQREGSHRSRCWAAERSDWFQRLQFLVVGTFLLLLVGGWRWLGAVLSTAGCQLRSAWESCHRSLAPSRFVKGSNTAYL